jgi:hypothetical protein
VSKFDTGVQQRADEATEARLDPAVRGAFEDYARSMEAPAPGYQTGLSPNAHRADNTGSGDTLEPDAVGGMRRGRQR